MGSASPPQVWPNVTVPSAVQGLISHFFTLIDTNNPSSGDILASQIFSSDGRAEFGGRWYEGTAEIRRSRDNAWKVVKTRKHTVQKVYVDGPAADDLLFVGHIAMEFANGGTVEQQFAGRFVLDCSQASAPKIQMFQVWADSGPTLKVLQAVP